MQGGPDPFCRGAFPWTGGDEALEAEIRALLWQRRQSRALQTGTLRAEAPAPDTIRIIREIVGGRDVFGRPAADERKEIEIQRE